MMKIGFHAPRADVDVTFYVCKSYYLTASKSVENREKNRFFFENLPILTSVGR